MKSELENLIKICDKYQNSVLQSLKHNDELRQLVKKIIEAYEQIELRFNKSDKCSICYTREKSYMLDCGHVFCENCSNRCIRAARCHICRAPPSEMKKIFY